MTFTFGIRKHIKEAWALYKVHFGKFFLLAAIILLINFLENEFHPYSVSILFSIIGLFISYICTRSILDLLDTNQFNPFSKKSLPSLSQFWDFFKTAILTAILIILSFIPASIPAFGIMTEILSEQPNMQLFALYVFLTLLLSIPTLYVSSRLFFAPYISVEKKQGAVKTIKECWNMTRGYGWRLVGLYLVVAVIIVLGFLAYYVGALITYPIGMIMFVMLYREFTKFAKSHHEVPTPHVPEHDNNVTSTTPPAEPTPTPYVEKVEAEKISESN